MTGHLADADLHRMSGSGVTGLSNEEGLALFDAALAAERALLLPIRLNMRELQAGADLLPPLLRGLVRTPGRRVLGASAGTDDESGLTRRMAGLSVGEQRSMLMDLVRGNVATVLGHASSDAVQANRAFKELGFDSLTAVELRNRLTAATGLRLPVTVVFDHPTPAALTGHLLTQLVPDAEEQTGLDAAELRVRQALADIPLTRLREAGLMDALLDLAGLHADTAAGAAADGRDGAPADTPEQQEQIDTMDTQSLIALALQQTQS
ncbi:hypothetical protein ADK64_04945 [Streptomyces sp. MMG1121]|nr:hypothetical protein ADK64_04945 [Streptomyces sp. MMG1121]